MNVYLQFLNNPKSNERINSKINDANNTIDIGKQHLPTFRLQSSLVGSQRRI